MNNNIMNPKIKGNQVFVVFIKSEFLFNCSNIVNDQDLLLLLGKFQF